VSNRTINLNDHLYDYLLAVSLRESPHLKALREETAALPLAIMQIAPEQGQFMALLVELIGARRTIEVGVFTGYSTLCVASALPAEGRITACDVSVEWTDVARKYWALAGVDQKIDLQLAPATETLDGLLQQGEQDQFDFAFIDADKANYDGYYERCLQLIRPGGLIAIDNTLWSGDVADDNINDADTVTIRSLNRKLLQDPRISLSLLPLADGLTLARKR